MDRVSEWGVGGLDGVGDVVQSFVYRTEGEIRFLNLEMWCRREIARDLRAMTTMLPPPVLSKEGTMHEGQEKQCAFTNVPKPSTCSRGARLGIFVRQTHFARF